MSMNVTLCNIDELPVKGSLGFDPFNDGHDTVFIVNTDEGPVAYKDICPHYGDTSLPWRKDKYLNASASKIVCSAHGAKFDISTGLCVMGPCIGQSLISVPLEITEDGQILASINKKG